MKDLDELERHAITPHAQDPGETPFGPATAGEAQQHRVFRTGLCQLWIVNPQLLIEKG